MDREKEIEERVKEIERDLFSGVSHEYLWRDKWSDTEYDRNMMCRILAELDYRKADEVRRELFAELMRNVDFDGHSVGVAKNDIIKLAQKYGVDVE